MQDLAIPNVGPAAEPDRFAAALFQHGAGKWAPGANERSHPGSRDIAVLLCRDPAILEAAQRLRYELRRRESGPDLRSADHDKQIITDTLDASGYTLVATQGDETIGTLRVNLPSEEPLGELEELFGMTTSPYHPYATALCTRFVVRNSTQGAFASIALLSALARLSDRFQIRECYIDMVAALVPFLQAIGFKISGPLLADRENVPSYPMMIDLEEHGDRLCDERISSRSCAARDP
jgi:hypothetical protein